MTTLIADCETNGLLDHPNLRFHMLQIGDADGTDSVIYADLPAAQIEDVAARKLLRSPIRPIAEGLARLAAADQYVFHNGLGFDYWAINRFFPGTLDRHKMIDTLVLARLYMPEIRDHSLAAWGRKTGTLKGTYKGDYQTVDDEFLVYSEGDIDAGRALYHRVKPVLAWGESSQVEHEAAYCIKLQEHNGFLLNVEGAQALAADLRGELDEIGQGLQETFPPLERVVVKINKANNKPRGWVKGETRTERKMEPFNPASRRHCVERLMLAGWKPTVKNDGDGQWKLDEKILSSLPFPEAKVLLSFFGKAKMLAQLSDGKEGWLRHVKKDGRVHGRVNSNGAVTGRMSHSKPNMANIDKDPRMRSLWGPRPGWSLVGCDAEGIEARMLAHYLFKWDQGAYAKVCLEGSSKLRTDVHSANIKQCIKIGLLPMAVWKDPALFDKARNAAPGIKTILYAMMYGAQDRKIGETIRGMIKGLGLPLKPIAAAELGAMFRRAVGSAILGFTDLTEAVKLRSKQRKWLKGLDGRQVICRSQHSALNTLLQGGGAVAMKKALAISHAKVEAAGYRCADPNSPPGFEPDFGYAANVHDEVQLECRPEIADQLGRMMEDAIREAGEHFKLTCPLAGKAGIGSNWAETH